jgi:uncharacterized protein YodC (DUF2158 family)
MTEGLSEGDMVVLKSGGPIMTISALIQTADRLTLAYCQWFSDENKLESHRFRLSVLKRIKNSE